MSEASFSLFMTVVLILAILWDGDSGGGRRARLPVAR